MANTKQSRRQAKPFGLNKASEFSRDVRGNVMILTGLLIIPLLIIAGGAIDLIRATSVRNQLYEALDATALSAGKASSLNDTQLQAYAQSFFNTVFPPRSDLSISPIVTVRNEDGNVNVSATVDMQNYMLPLAKLNTFSIAATTEVTRSLIGVEVAFALDVTGSMAGGTKIEDMRVAAKDAVDILYSSIPQGTISTTVDGDLERLRLSLVPFVTAVNIKNEEYNSSWMDGADGRAPLAQYHGINFLHVHSNGKPDARVKVNHFDLFNSVGSNGVAWAGCVEARPGARDVTDAPPVSTDADSLWVPYFWPDEYDCMNGACGSDRATHVSAEADTAGRDIASTSGKYTNANRNFVQDREFTEKTGSAKTNYALFLSRIFKNNGDVRNGNGLGTNPGLPQDSANRTPLRAWLNERDIDEADDDEYRLRSYYPGFYNSSTKKYVGRYDLISSSAIQEPNLNLNPATTTASNNGVNTRGPNRSCPRPLVPLVDDRDRIDGEIDAMEPINEGGTNIAAGLAWAWRTLSPGEPFTGGASYDNDQVQKYLILLTDGQNIVRFSTTQDTSYKSDYYPYGFLRDERLGSGIDTVSEAEDAVDSRVASLCSSIKNEGIRIYTIAFEVSNNDIRTILRNCASEPSLAYDTRAGDDLAGSFRQIAEDIANLHISQ